MTIDYRTTIFNLSRHLHRLRELSVQMELDSLVERIDFVLNQLESHKFTVAVVGEFKRGKSTFINALLGREVLPADVLPTSATLNRVTYGEKRVEIHFRSNSGEPERIEQIPIDRLIDFVTKLTPQAETIAQTVREAVVYFPAPFCKNYNTDIYDTPGLGDEATMTDITMRVLPQVDATVMIVMATAPFADSESKFVWELLQRGLPTPLFVINAIDRVREQHRQRLIEEIKQRIESSIQRYAESNYEMNSAEYDSFMKRYGQVRVFALSSFQALEGKVTNNADLLESSTFRVFEDALEKFLAEESSTIAFQARAREMVIIGQSLGKHVTTRLEELSKRRTILHSMESQIVNLLQQVLQSGQAELRQFSETTNQIEIQIRPMTEQFRRELKSGLQKAVNTLSITQDEWRQSETSNQFDTIKQRILSVCEVEIEQINVQFADQVAAAVETVISKNLQSRVAFIFTYDRIMQHLFRQGYLIRDESETSLVEAFGLQPRLDGVKMSVVRLSAKPIIQAVDSAQLRTICAEAISTAQTGVIIGNRNSRIARLAQNALGVTGFKIALNNEIGKLIDSRYIPNSAILAALTAEMNELIQPITSALNSIQTHLLEMHGHQERVAGLAERELADLEAIWNDVNKITQYGQALANSNDII